jgi:hypothetical protein
MRSMRTPGGLASALLVAAAAAAAPSPAAPVQVVVAPEALSDEFEQASLSPEWAMFHDRYGWPNKIKALDVGRSTPGALRLEPYHSAWVRDLQAPFLFKTVSGDFDVRARVRMKGAANEVPGGTWSLGGLMARVPNGATAADWQPNRENWHFITTGVGFEAGKPMTETKGTFNSYSSLKLRPFSAGWVELRLVRVGMAMFALARRDGEQQWQLRDRFYRMDVSPDMQVGLIAYTTSSGTRPGPDNAAVANREVNREARVDAVFEVDWVRGKRPMEPRSARRPVGDRPGPELAAYWYAQVNGGNPLTDPNLPVEEVLRLIGD